MTNLICPGSEDTHTHAYRVFHDLLTLLQEVIT